MASRLGFGPRQNRPSANRERLAFEQRFTFIDFGRSQIWSSKAMPYAEPGVRGSEYRAGVRMNASRRGETPDFFGCFGPSDYSTRLTFTRLDCVVDDNHLGSRMAWRNLLAHLMVTGVCGEHYEVPPGGGVFVEREVHCDACRRKLPEHDDASVMWTAYRPMAVMIPARQNFYIHLNYTSEIEVPIAFLRVTVVGEAVRDIA